MRNINYQDPYQLNKETAIIYLFAKLLTEIKETKSYKTSEIKSNDLETLSKYNNLNNLSKSKIRNKFVGNFILFSKEKENIFLYNGILLHPAGLIKEYTIIYISIYYSTVTLAPYQLLSKKDFHMLSNVFSK